MSAEAGRRRRVLVAEDDDQMRCLVADVLRRAGFDVDEVRDGREMWHRTFQERNYDLVVSDLRLPVVDGLTVLEDLHARTPTMPLILMSAFSDVATRSRAERLGVVYLDKPFPMQELYVAVRRACGGP